MENQMSPQDEALKNERERERLAQLRVTAVEFASRMQPGSVDTLMYNTKIIYEFLIG